MEHQARTYDEMTQKGWYVIKNVKASEVKQTLSKIQSGN